ncbi:DUF2313 domain-containing protein [Desulfovibrio sp. OttesenSCG-928-C06]|nr:DUF2313 domain-containing protein [Desulfovibrio sp. OttesenSCG-928-C06]
MPQPPVRTPEEYTDMQQSLLPRGPAWNRAPGSVLTLTLESAAQEMTRVDESAHLLLRETNPTTAIDALEDYERVLGLPDSCLPSGDTLQERRMAVLLKLADTGRQDKSYWYEMAANLGYSIDIEHNAPFVCGESDCGNTVERLGPEEIRYWWIVVVHGPRVIYFRCGESACGDSLGEYQIATDLECLMQRDKEAHTFLTFDYEPA